MHNHNTQQLNLWYLLNVLAPLCPILNSAAKLFWWVPSLASSYLKSQSPFQQLGDVFHVSDVVKAKSFFLGHLFDKSLLWYNTSPVRAGTLCLSFSSQTLLGPPQCLLQGRSSMWFVQWASVWLWVDTRLHLSLCPLFWPLSPFSITDFHWLRILWLTKCSHKQYLTVISINIASDGSYLTQLGKCRGHHQASQPFHLPALPPTAWRGHMVASGLWASWRTRTWWVLQMLQSPWVCWLEECGRTGGSQLALGFENIGTARGLASSCVGGALSWLLLEEKNITVIPGGQGSSLAFPKVSRLTRWLGNQPRY